MKFRHKKLGTQIDYLVIIYIYLKKDPKFAWTVLNLAAKYDFSVLRNSTSLDIYIPALAKTESGHSFLKR